MKWILGLGAVLAVAAAAVVALLAWTLAREPGGPPTADTRSSEIAGLEDRRTFLDTYLGPRPYADLEADTPPDSALVFWVTYRNNGGLIPGPSDWTTKVAARVPPDSLDVWLRGFGPADSLDTSWLRDLEPGPRVDGVDEWYGDRFRMVGLDRERGVVAAYSSTM